MKIYVTVCCVTYDSRGATGSVKETRVSTNMKDAMRYVKEEIEYLRGENRILDLQEYESSYQYSADYIALEGFDYPSERTAYQWRINELEIKEEIIKLKKLQATEQQQEYISFMLDDDSDLLCTYNDCIKIDGYISYEDMAKIVDYLRKEE